jgi:hypothetical protein
LSENREEKERKKRTHGVNDPTTSKPGHSKPEHLRREKVYTEEIVSTGRDGGRGGKEGEGRTAKTEAEIKVGAAIPVLVINDGDVRSGSVCTRTSEVDALQVRQESG